MMPYYHFRQNNSGGSFDEDPSRGIGASVWIAAETAEDANDRAERLGIYFNGVVSDRDCSCCGDRWYPAQESDGNIAPTTNKYSPDESYVHDVDGKITVIKRKKE